MKTTHKNLTTTDYATKSSHLLLERIRNILKLNSVLNYPAEGFKSSIIVLSETKENQILRNEAEIRRNQTRVYAGIAPPK
jgi:hypothetical protein